MLLSIELLELRRIDDLIEPAVLDLVPPAPPCMLLDLGGAMVSPDLVCLLKKILLSPINTNKITNKS